ncbi:MAG: N-acetyl-gamma-glutamyl-phosphate reductase, partial [Candidatus Contendobacter sp.]|nr:N-acetyl-gamma-glutamyl-phosphate reductase [Candidatus Contendobacter sp.]
MIKAGIVGGTGYTGVELLRLLALHPAVELAVITSR